MVNRLNFTYFNCFLPPQHKESDENTENVENVDSVEPDTSQNEDVTCLHGLINICTDTHRYRTRSGAVFFAIEVSAVQEVMAHS